MKFTIGLPITKTGHLKAALDSIESQTFQDFELIIKNNAATKDKKEEIKNFCENWIKKENVQYFESEEQLSMTYNFNTVLEKANGEYFMMMSDDDILDPDYLKEFKLLIEKYPEFNVFHCRVKIIDINGNLVDFSENCPEWESQIDFLFQRLKEKRTLFLSDFVLNTKAFKAAGGFTNLPSGWGTDEINWIKLGKNGFIFTPKILLEYRKFLGNFSLSKENLLKRFEDIDIMHNFLDKVIDENCSIAQSIYPKQFLLKLSQERKLKQENYVLSFYAKTSNIFEILKFYTKHSDRLKAKTLGKTILLKVIKKNKA